MQMREMINRHRALTLGAMVVVVALALSLSLRRSFGPGRGTRITQAFYSDDDGKNYFVDELGKSSPFDHEGKPAYRAYVYRCTGSRATFVGYLARQNPDEKSQGPMESTGDAVKAGIARSKSVGAMEVKRPGDPRWVALGSVEGTAISDVACPNGERPLAVVPGI